MFNLKIETNKKLNGEKRSEELKVGGLFGWDKHEMYNNQAPDRIPSLLIPSKSRTKQVTKWEVIDVEWQSLKSFSNIH